MLKAISQVQKKIKVGTHGEDYGSWMSNPVFYVFGGGTLLAAVLAVLSFTTFHSTVLGVIFTVAVVGLLAGLGWITWIRRQYAFGKGGMMDTIVKQADDALKARELIKGKVLETAPLSSREAADQLASAVSADVVQVIGRVFVLYRHNPEEPQIKLPR